jgi:hypothetical protein
MSRLDVTVIVFSALNIMLAHPRKEKDFHQQNRGGKN